MLISPFPNLLPMLEFLKILLSIVTTILSNIKIVKQHFGESICKPLELIFKRCLQNGRFPLKWKKANVVLVHRKGDKQTIKNYHPVSLPPICGKIFERLLYDTMFNFFSKNNLLSPNQSGFRPRDSCINQLLSVNHEILSAFDTGLEVRGIFLDISKAFDKVWHDGLIFKLREKWYLR